MKNEYSLYEAKAKFSSIVRQVREGHSVVVTLHGEPVAEIRPIQPGAETLEQRMDRLVERGVLVRARESASALAPIAKKPGALDRFLHDRDQ
jgi:prevent-host-death family protein